MARYEFKLPDIGEGVTEGEIVSWLVQPGDPVTFDQPIVEIMTDKATVTITAPKAGTVVETNGKVGDTIPVHGVLVVFELDPAGLSSPVPLPEIPPPAPKTNGTSGHPAVGSARATDAADAALAVGQIQESLPGMRGVSRPPPGASYFNSKPLATPHTRKVARDANVDLRRVPPSGENGRVTKTDVESFVEQAPEDAEQGVPALHAGRDEAPASPPPSRGQAPANAREPARGTEGTEAAERRVPLAGLRRRIAQKMSRSKSTAAHFTFVEECDVTELKALRARLKEPAQARGVKLTFLPFIVKAVVAALKAHPVLNSTLDESTNEIVYRNTYNIGIAAATEAGLMVPVLHDADARSLLDVAREIERLGEDARRGKTKHEDLVGSTFTITSLGAQSGLLATPIINFPEVAILGVHQMKQKPVVKNGQIVIGDVMLLSLSFDHRIVDGHVGAAFAYEVIGYLEQPERLWLELT
jgi:pyruvate dehydrogenase E2 component (dihydrolipoamide acetyltransferase)